MDDERLKNPPVGSSVLERIRDIHASMRRVYLQVICPPADSQPTVSPLREGANKQVILPKLTR